MRTNENRFRPKHISKIIYSRQESWNNLLKWRQQEKNPDLLQVGEIKGFVFF